MSEAGIWRCVNWADGLLKAVFACNHHQAQPSEGKFFCHGCGRGMIARWVLLRCTGCGRKRNTRYFLRRIRPQEACCLHCGEANTHLEYLERPSYFHLHHALLQIEEETVYLQQHVRKSRAWAWLDPPPRLSVS